MTFSVKKFSGGVHPNDGKEFTKGSSIQTAPLLEKYNVILQQHIGAPPKLIVKNGDEVKRGQLIAESGGFVSAPVHAPTSGKVKLVDCMGPAGISIPAVEITSDGKDEWADGIGKDENWEKLSPEEMKGRIAGGGVVGMGGAAFPVSVKLSPPKEKKINTLILNGAECEPHLTADHRLMLEEADKILCGASILGKVLDVKDIYVGIENNKPDAIQKMQEIASGYGIKIVPLRVMYPQGAEKQLIYAIKGRKVPTGGLPMDVGCVVQNVGTAAAVYDAVVERKPLIERITTVTGKPVCKPGNWKLRIGTSLSKVLELVGGINEQPAKLILGGPMMGQSQTSIDVPIMKNASGVLLMAAEEVSQYTSHACIRCGFCVDVCPMNLIPSRLSMTIESERFDLAEYEYVIDCIECGCCAYVCPAKRPLVQHFRRGKSEIIAARRKTK